MRGRGWIVAVGPVSRSFDEQRAGECGAGVEAGAQGDDEGGVGKSAEAAT